MASNNNYYYGDPERSDHYASSAYHTEPHFSPSPRSNATPAPSYRTGLTSSTPSYPQDSYSQGPYQPPASHQASHQGGNVGPSPFATAFDDNVYPVSSQEEISRTNSETAYQRHQAADTMYYGHDRPSSDGRQQQPSAEDIPLQDRNAKVGRPLEMDDHIYDDPQGGRRRKKKKPHKVGLGELGMLGSDRKRIPWVVYVFSLVQIAVFIAEVARNAILTGSPIMIKPQFNPMIGPSSQVMINMGARYVPCMHNVKDIQGSDIPVYFLCPNATTNENFCPLSELCGFDGKVPNPVYNGDAKQQPRPNQWYRFIIPIFMHAGIIHIGFNLLLQLTLAKEMEMAIGSVRFFLVYMSAGVFGFVMGGNFAAPGISSTGASGSLFGILALTLLDLLYSWKERKNPVKDLLLVIVDMVISFVLGLLPGLDNFSHIGGFLMGLALGICVLHSPNSLRRRLGEDPSYSSVPPGATNGQVSFLKSPLSFFQGRKPLWWGWWFVRAAALIAIIVVFIVLLNNFYNSQNTCGWCKYLSCIPVNGWCDLGTIKKTEVPAR